MNELNKRNRRLKARRKQELYRKKRKKVEAAKKYAEDFRGKAPLDSIRKIKRDLALQTIFKKGERNGR